MADYYPLIARAVAGLDKNTGDGRRALYERARTALVAQLRSVEPALNETDITRERLALEEAIRKVEAESARKARTEPPRAESRVRALDASRWEAASRWDRPAQAPTAEPSPPTARKTSPPPWLEPAPSAAEVSDEAHPVDQNVDQPSGPDTSEPELPLTPPRSSTQPQPVGDGRALRDAALSNLRDVVSEADELGDASARAVKSARESFAAVAAPPPPYDHADEQPTPQEPRDDLPTPEMLEPTFSADEPRP